MKTTVISPREFSKAPLTAAALASLMAAAAFLPSAVYAQANWEGPNANNDGSSGVWQNSNFSRSVAASIDAIFRTDDTITSLNTTVTVNAGSSVASRGLFVRNYVANSTKSVTINLEAGSTLATGAPARTTGVINAGGISGEPSVQNSSILTINGPVSGSANFMATRLYMEGNTINLGSTHRNSLIIQGAGLNLLLDGGFSAAGNRSDILFDGGVKVTTQAFATSTNSAGGFHVRVNSEHAAPGTFENWMTVRNATISLHTVDIRGLFQLDTQGTLVATTKTTTEGAPEELGILVGTADGKGNARFEAAGAGLDARATVTVYKGGTFAIGVADPLTRISEASNFTLNSNFTFSAESTLEFDIFGGGANDVDRLIIGDTGSLTNNGTGPQIVLNLNGYTLTGSESWSLIDTTNADANWLTGNFDLSLIDTNIWDLSAFNSAGNWTISAQAIPEPSTYALLGFSALAAAGWMKRRRSA